MTRPVMPAVLALACTLAPLVAPRDATAQDAPQAMPATRTIDVLAAASPADTWRAEGSVASQVRGGVLALSPSDRWLHTRATFADTTCRLEFRPAPLGTACVLVRAFVPPGDTVPHRGYEVWVPDPGRGNGKVVVRTGGQVIEAPFDEGLLAAAWDSRAEWQSLLVEARGGSLDVFLNGRKVFAGTNAIGQRGTFGLRADGGGVEWRRIELTHRPRRPTLQGLRAEDLSSLPRVTREEPPRYTASGIRRRVEGEVLLECIVDAKGAVPECAVLEELDPELDAEALKAARRWRFEPGRLDGKAVDALVTLSMTFTLRPERPSP